MAYAVIYTFVTVLTFYDFVSFDKYYFVCKMTSQINDFVCHNYDFLCHFNFYFMTYVVMKKIITS